ncbi:MAG TPA: hypothetical protein VN426_13570 [Syntrophomonadaceae bacterium]|nr:hypothetical protein [Syntrophomonadaceae bacterium]
MIDCESFCRIFLDYVEDVLNGIFYWLLNEHSQPLICPVANGTMCQNKNRDPFPMSHFQVCFHERQGNKMSAKATEFIISAVFMPHGLIPGNKSPLDTF